jgi:hypothetical protein
MGLGSAPLYQPGDEVLYKGEEDWIVDDVDEDAVGGWKYDLVRFDDSGPINAFGVYEGELE